MYKNGFQKASSVNIHVYTVPVSVGKTEFLSESSHWKGKHEKRFLSVTRCLHIWNSAKNVFNELCVHYHRKISYVNELKQKKICILLNGNIINLLMLLVGLPVHFLCLLYLFLKPHGLFIFTNMSKSPFLMETFR